jgi:SPP1 gp7 family putative phage head morphogenesis protein
MATVLQLAKQFRSGLVQEDKQAANALIRAYGDAYQHIQKDVKRLTDQIEEARRDGSKVSEAWLFREGRLRILKQQVELQVQHFARFADHTILQTQHDAISKALHAAQSMIMLQVDQSNAEAASGYTFARLPAEQLEVIVGELGDGSPLRARLGRLGPVAAEKAGDVLTRAVALGYGAAQTSRELREALGEPLTDTLRIARTEQMRSARAASIDSYRANSDVVPGWMRIAELDDTTCPICIALHGTRYSTEQDFDTHPNCRCTCIPEVVGVERQIQTGSQWFEKQSAKVQLEVLGEQKYAAYHDGKISLMDLVQHTESLDWGGGYRERTLDEALAYAADHRQAA